MLELAAALGEIERFVYGLVIGAFTSDSYLKMMEHVAEIASQHLAKTGCITVVGQDNGPIHTSDKVHYSLAGMGKSGTLPVPIAQILFRDEPN